MGALRQQRNRMAQYSFWKKKYQQAYSAVPPPKKKAHFDDFSERQVKEIPHKINSSPRENLKFYSPKEIFFRYLHDLKLL
ncbi:MAG: hypothetical protein LBB79_01495 [Prevotellaceae bacterium]|jgi:hypothetical protein|nr:hypothetical protein [Prevotellaceae bacterium]